MRAFVAQFDDLCDVCGEPIYGGDELIVMVDDEPCHTDCAEDEGIEVEQDD